MVRLTARAAAKVRELMAEAGDPAPETLRVSIAGGGCAGFRYDLVLDGAPHEGDVAARSHGVTVVVDGRSAAYVAGAGLDYVEGPAGAGFSVENPNAAGGCGCGGSFRAAEAAPPAPAADACAPGCGCAG